MSIAKRTPAKSRVSPKKKASRHKSEVTFLAGRQSPLRDTFRVIRISLEFIKGFFAFSRLGPAVTVFGSARLSEEHSYCKLAQEISGKLAKQGYAIITGGGPGIMEAANRGAYEARGLSIGANIVLPEEQHANRFLNRLVTFYYFFIRKVILVKYSFVYIFLPGGFGTLDELAESLTLIQTGKLLQFPIILVGKDYWKGLLKWMENTQLKHGAISQADLDYIIVTDSVEEILNITKDTAKRFKLTLRPV